MIPNNYTLTASVDWLDLSVRTTRGTNGPTIFRKTGLFATPLSPEQSGADQHFIIRLHDVSTWWEAERCVERFAAKFPLSDQISIVGLELSLDFRIPGASISELAALTCDLFKMSTLMVSNNRRILGEKKGLTKGVTNGAVLTRELEAQCPIFVGNATDPRTQRFYVKTADRAGKVQLPQCQWSARMENTYRRAEECSPTKWWLPEDLALGQCISFESVAKDFYLRKIEGVNDTSLHAKIIERLPQLGERRQQIFTGGGRRLYSKSTRADQSTNRTIYEALRGLSTRWKRVPHRYRDATVMQHYLTHRTRLLGEKT